MSLSILVCVCKISRLSQMKYIKWNAYFLFFYFRPFLFLELAYVIIENILDAFFVLFNHKLYEFSYKIRNDRQKKIHLHVVLLYFL